MAKLTGPLLSFGARGQIGKAMITSKWKGIAYARQYTKPANPQTTAQQNNRTRFALLREAYKLAPSEVRAPWLAFASGRPFTDANKFVGENNRLLVGQTDFLTGILSPGARGGLPPSAVNVSTGAGAGEIDVEVIVPTQLPTGWTVNSIAAGAFPQQDPIGIFEGPFIADSDVPPATTLTLSGFTTGDNIMAWGWVVYDKPDGSLAYSVSLGDEALAG